MTNGLQKLTKAKMARITSRLNESGYLSKLSTEEDELGESYWIAWGDWSVYPDGSIYIGAEDFPVNDCDLVGFINDVHKAWHEVGGQLAVGT